MNRDTRSDILFVALAGAVTYGLAGPVPAVVVAAVALLVSVGWRGPVALLRRAASTAWDGLRGSVRSVPAARGASVGLRWLLVVFLAGVLVGRGFDGVTLPRIVLPNIDWPHVVVPDLIPDPTGPLTAVVVYETDEPLSRTQYTGLYSEAVRSYIASHFDVRAGHAEWRIFDDDGLDLSEESDGIKAAYQQAVSDGGGKRWLVIRRAGETVHSGELPADGPGLLAVFKQYGGE